MAFCTSCGATVNGAFCQQCGTPASASTAHSMPPAQPSAAQPVVSPAGVPVAAPVARRTSPIVWILVGLVGLFLLCVIGVMAAGYFFVRNPGVVMGKLITASNPNVEVLSTDLGAKTLRIRDKHTGKEVTVSFDDVKNGRLKFSATDDEGKMASVEIGEGAGKLPSWVPAYPGAKAEGNLTARGESADGMGEGGMVSFTTSDSASKVMEFYQDKLKDMGMKVDLNGASNEGGMIAAADDSGKSIQVMVGSGSGSATTIAITFGRKR